MWRARAPWMDLMPSHLTHISISSEIPIPAVSESGRAWAPPEPGTHRGSCVMGAQEGEGRLWVTHCVRLFVVCE